MLTTDEFVGVVEEDDSSIAYNPVLERRLNHKVKAENKAV